MRKMKRTRFLAAFMVCLIICSLLPTAALADDASASEMVVYVSENGSDDADGLSAESAVKTFGQAYTVLTSGSEHPDAGTIYVSGTVDVPSDYSTPETGFPVTITSVENGDGNLKIKGNLFLNGATTFDEIQMTAVVKGLRYIVANCHALTIGDGVECIPAGTYYLNLVGGGFNEDITGNADMTICGGQWNNVYGASYCSSDKTKGIMHGNVSIDISGGTITTLAGGTYLGGVDGSIDIDITGGKFNGTDSNKKGIYAAGIFPNLISGDVSINIHGSSNSPVEIAGSVYGGNREPDEYSGSTVSGNVSVSVSNANVGGNITAGGVENCTKISGTPHVALGTNLSLHSAVTANTFSGGGTLTLSSAASLTVTDSISGKTSVSISSPLNNQTYLMIPDGYGEDAFTLTDAPEGAHFVYSEETHSYVCQGALDPEEEKFILSVEVPKDAKEYKLYSSYSNYSSVIDCSAQSTLENGNTLYQYFDLEPGTYSYVLSGKGSYKYNKPFLITEEDVNSGSKGMTLELLNMAGTKWETLTTDSGTVRYLTDEATERFSTSGLTMDGSTPYEPLKTPGVSSSKAADEYTTQAEMLNVVETAATSSPYMYEYTLGTTEYGNEVPLVLCTTANIPEGATLQEAASIVRQTGKPIVQYTAQIHGNENSGGDGALAMIQAMAGEYDSTFDPNEILDSMEIYIIPRVNPDGSEAWTRRNPTSGDDMNRDHLLSLNPEIQMIHKAFLLFQPEVAIDGHEFSGGFVSSGDVADDENGDLYLTNLDDVRISGSGSLNSDPTINSKCNEMVYQAFDDCIKSGLRVFDYGATVANVNGRAYYGLLNCYSFLIETRGIYLSKGVNFERRVFAQYTTVKSMLHYVKDHSDEITSNVARARDEIVKNGLHYSDDQLLVLQSAKSRTAGSGYTLHRPSFRFDGTYQDANQQNTFYYYDTAVRTRIAPTAYVIPIGETWAETVKKGLELSGAEIFTVSAGTTLSLQQYQQKTLGSDAEAKLTDTQEFTFPQGAYVIPMDQSCAMAIAMTLEPDVTDTTDGCSLVATKVLVADSDGNYPLYRCIQDSPRTALNLDGSGSGSSGSSSGSSGGSSTPAVKENYAITISDTVNGTVSSNVSKAAAGVTVTLTVKANSGYALDTLTVTDANGKTVTVSQNGGKYTFVMPAKAVTVKATFAAGTSSGKSFTDVPADHWACSPISWAAANGYMNGVSATVFQPNGTVTRQQLWMILARLSGASPANMVEARTWAVANGISDGSNPSGAVTRQQLVAILYRYAQLMSYKTSGGTELTGYPDNTSVAGYAKDAMSWSVGNGIVAGTTDGKLNPTGTATRAQFAVILMRFTSKMA